MSCVAEALAGPELVAVDPRPRREQPLDQLQLAHLEADEQDGLLQLADDVLADVQGERRLPHARPGREDDELRPLEAAGDLVEVEVARSPTPGDGVRGPRPGR